MAAKQTNLVQRSLRQVDRAFWQLRDHPVELAILGLPTLVSTLCLVGGVIAIVRGWTLDSGLGYLLWAIVLPVAIMMIFTFGPTPCSVFVWRFAKGESATLGECLSWCAQRSWRLWRVAGPMLFSFFWWTLFWGLPMLVFWPRTCLAPSVALFENERRIFWRAKRMIEEPAAILAIAAIYGLAILSFGILIFLPRIFLQSEIYQSQWLESATEMLWALEFLCSAVLLCAMAICWNITLTLLYFDLRTLREGEDLKGELNRLTEKYLVTDGRS